MVGAVLWLSSMTVLSKLIGSFDRAGGFRALHGFATMP
jgi:hypothetical protein